MAARILVVEDNEDNMRLMVYLLRSFGYEPELAADGAEGILRAAELRPDLILMDIQMPEVDGYEATVAIRKATIGPGPTIVAVTASAMLSDRERISEAGFDGYITKPITPETFLPEVEAFIPEQLRARRGAG